MTIEQRAAIDRVNATFAASDYDYRWLPTDGIDWSDVSYQRVNQSRVNGQRRRTAKRRRSLNGPVTVRHVAPRS